MKYFDDLYHNCRNCHWFVGGGCVHGKTFRTKALDPMIIQYISEDGIIDAAIREGFSDRDFSDLKNNLESLLSKKKTREVLQEFDDELDGVINNWVGEIDYLITRAIQNELENVAKDNGVEIVDPDEFYCRYFE